MMAWPGELEEQVQQRWRSRFAKKRADLSISVEETLADSTLPQELLDDELDEPDEPVQGGKSATIIPPRLSLQSKAIPVVRVEQKEATNVAVVDARSTDNPVEVPTAGHRKQRLAGRTTKVHLQAIPKPDKKPAAKKPEELDKNERSTPGETQAGAKQRVTRETDALIEGQIKSAARGTLTGSGVFMQGQKEVSVANSHISTTSVVVVTLTSDPGPVVVKYISLKPQHGFTIHLSAPAEAEAPFNYVVLMGELF